MKGKKVIIANVWICFFSIFIFSLWDIFTGRLVVASELAVVGGLVGADPTPSPVARDILSLSPGQWYQIRGSSLAASGAYPKPPPPGIVGPRSVIDAWSGGVYDPLGKLFLIWGGGHGDYAGNEIYSFDLDPASTAAFKWQRLWGPTPNEKIPQEANVSHHIYQDGNPGSRHTYDGLAFDPTTGAHGIFYGVGGSIWSIGWESPWAWTFDMASGEWTQRDKLEGVSYGWTSVFDSTRGKIITRTSIYIYRYDPVTGKHVRIYSNAPSPPWGDDATSVYDPIADQILYFQRGTTRPLEIYNVGTGVYEKNLVPDGDQALVGIPGIGVDYDGWNQEVVAYRPIRGVNAKTVYKWDREARAWSEVIGTLAGESVSPAETAPPAGIYGRWAYVPHLRGFVLINRATTDVYFYKSGPPGHSLIDPVSPVEP